MLPMFISEAKFTNEFFTVEDTEVVQGMKQLNIGIDIKKFANELRYSLAEIEDSMPYGTVTDPQGISLRTCDDFPSIIVVNDPNERPTWVKTEDVVVGKAASAANAELLGFKKPEDYVTYSNFDSDLSSFIESVISKFS